MNKIIIGAMLIIAFMVFVVGGVMNIVKLTRLDFQPPCKAEIIRVGGIVLGYGPVVGFMDIKDK
jgi:hypothetical protein